MPIDAPEDKPPEESFEEPSPERVEVAAAADVAPWPDRSVVELRALVFVAEAPCAAAI